MTSTSSSKPAILCACGCGEPVEWYGRTPRRYIALHSQRRTVRPLPANPPNPSGLCQCGCGQQTMVAQKNVSRLGWIKGEHVRYIRGHNASDIPRERIDSYHEENRGFETPCWIWDGSVNSEGYGVITTDSGRKKAHRVYFERHRGPIPYGLEPDHLCRQRDCVRPEHMEAVTRAINTRRGLSTKLTHDQVEAIRASSLSSRAAAAIFGISRGHVKSIRRRESWR